MRPHDHPYTPGDARVAVLRGLTWLGASTVAELAAWRALQHVSRDRIRRALTQLAGESLVEPAGVGDRNARCYRLTDAGRERVKTL